jgi:hypothetical protein
MKLTLTFKNPDVLEQIQEQFKQQKLVMKEYSNIDLDEEDNDEEFSEEEEIQIEDLKNSLKEWIKWGEYIEITYDTETCSLSVERQK